MGPGAARGGEGLELNWGRSGDGEGPLRYLETLYLAVIADPRSGGAYADRLEAVLSPEARTTLTRSGPYLWTGRWTVVQRDLYQSDAPIRLLEAATEGEPKKLGLFGAISIDSETPRPTALSLRPDAGGGWRLAWRDERLRGDEVHTLQRISPSGRIDSAARFTRLGAPAATLARLEDRAGMRWRIHTRDPAGQEGWTAWVRPDRRAGCFRLRVGDRRVGFQVCMEDETVRFRNRSDCPPRESRAVRSRDGWRVTYECDHRNRVRLSETWHLAYDAQASVWKGDLKQRRTSPNGSSRIKSYSVGTE